jgi:hypothetical protein
MPLPRQTIQQSMQKGQYTYAKQNMQVNTNFERQTRGHNRYTMYNTYTKRGGKGWKAFK